MCSGLIVAFEPTAETCRRHISNPADQFESFSTHQNWITNQLTDEASWGPCWQWQYNGSTSYTTLCWNYGNMQYTYTGYYDYISYGGEINFQCFGCHRYNYWTSLSFCVMP
jgi:hypothetical protein